jgi:hypothetical protein
VVGEQDSLAGPPVVVTAEARFNRASLRILPGMAVQREKAQSDSDAGTPSGRDAKIHQRPSLSLTLNVYRMMESG